MRHLFSPSRRSFKVTDIFKIHNPVIREWPGEADAQTSKNFELLPHHKVLERLDGFDQERGTKVSGHRGYFLKGPGAFLNQALIQYGLHFLTRKKGHTALQTPQLMNKEPMAQTAQLEQFDEELYKVIDGESEKYLSMCTPPSPFNETMYKTKQLLILSSSCHLGATSLSISCRRVASA